MFMIYSQETPEGPPAKGIELLKQSHRAVMEETAAQGILVAVDGLKPTVTATTVRMVGQKPMITDGPFAETKEQLGGYFMIEVPDLDTAISWAARCPAAGHGVVEVRPLWSM